MEKQCEDHFLQNIQKAQDSRLIVKLPFSEHTSALGESRDIATRRFLSLEKRLQKDQTIKKGYIEFMKEYEALGHMKEVPHIHLPKFHYFIPHHCVLKPDSQTTKLGVVFDASAVTSMSMSILLRFRMHKYVFTAHIEKTYRQIWINPKRKKTFSAKPDFGRNPTFGDPRL